MSAEPAGGEVVRFYTKARRFPRLLGKWPSGEPIWGGPYTSAQAIGGIATLLLLKETFGVWAKFGLANALILLGVPYGVTLALRKLPLAGRSPLRLAAGFISAYTQPSHGWLRGRPVRPPRPVKVRSRVTVSDAVPAAASRPSVPRPATQPAAARPASPAAPPPLVLTGVGQLLAQAGSPTKGGVPLCRTR
jgi:hypothetical protein